MNLNHLNSVKAHNNFFYTIVAVVDQKNGSNENKTGLSSSKKNTYRLVISRVKFQFFG